jgi:hypothetical protein
MPSFWKISALVGIALLLGVSIHALFADADLPPNAHIQMSRLDFSSPVDSAAAKAIQRTVMQQEGVKHCFFNQEAGLLTFGYDLRVQQKETVLSSVRERHDVEVGALLETLRSDVVQR